MQKILYRNSAPFVMLHLSRVSLFVLLMAFTLGYILIYFSNLHRTATGKMAERSKALASGV
jgi:hypothetical protein